MRNMLCLPYLLPECFVVKVPALGLLDPYLYLNLHHDTYHLVLRERGPSRSTCFASTSCTPGTTFGRSCTTSTRIRYTYCMHPLPYMKKCKYDTFVDIRGRFPNLDFQFVARSIKIVLIK